jgi:hypothetical protein
MPGPVPIPNRSKKAQPFPNIHATIIVAKHPIEDSQIHIESNDDTRRD